MKRDCHANLSNDVTETPIFREVIKAEPTQKKDCRNFFCATTFTGSAEEEKKKKREKANSDEIKPEFVQMLFISSEEAKRKRFKYFS